MRRPGSLSRSVEGAWVLAIAWGIAMLSLNGCSAPQGATKVLVVDTLATPQPPVRIVPDIPVTEAIDLIRSLERHPLAEDAPAIRLRVFEWVSTSQHVGAIDLDDRYLEQLGTFDYPYAGDLVMQYLFGRVLWRLTPDTTTNRSATEIEAGLRSTIACYRNIVQLQPESRHRFMDDLDQIRRLGKLGEYIRRVDAARE